MALTPQHVVGGTALVIAAGIAYAATRTAGPVPPAKYTELLPGPMFEHIVTEAELLTQPVRTRVHYPARVGPQISKVISQGFAPAYQPPDPQVAALPAEEPW
jgi:hypothetical protein